MEIIIYTGKTQYGALTLFAMQLKEAFDKKNFKTHIIDLVDDDCGKKIDALVQTGKIGLIIGFNGMGSELKTTQNISYYDVCKIYYLSIYVDHPAQQISRLVNYSQYNLASFIDKKHIDFVKEFIPDIQKVSFFLPHGGIEAEEFYERPTFEEYKNIKSIDLLFMGTYYNLTEKPWSDKEGTFEYLDKFTELLINDDYLSVSEAIKIVEEDYSLAFSNLGKVQMAILYGKALAYVRQYRRYTIIQKIFESNIPITVYGNGWEEAASKYSNVNYCGNLDMQEAINTIGKAKVIVNVNACFTNGGHERVFSSMLNNCVVFTDKSRYYEEYYKEEESILTYSLNSIEKDLNRLKEILKDDEKLYNIASKAYPITKENHTWENRADKIIKIHKLVKSIDTIRENQS